MKNVSLVDLGHGYKIFGSDGYPVDPFTTFVDFLARKQKSANTIKNYAHHVANFIDYLYEVGVFSDNPPESFDEINAFIDVYPELLVKAQNYHDEALAKVCRSLDRKPISKASAGIHCAAINTFLHLSEAIAKETAELTHLHVGSKIDKDNYRTVLNAISERTQISENEKIRIRQNSMLSGVVRKLPKASWQSESRSGLKSPRRRAASRNDYRDFPLSSIIPLINSAKTCRDRALYALCAGGGLRQSEALSVQMSDIDVLTRTVEIQDPDGLRNIDNLVREDRNRFKGRATAKVFLFEPLKTLFFENLEAYIASERIPTESHDFLFQYLDLPGNQNRAGTPYINVTNTALNNNFRSAQKIIGMTPDYTLHSLRHLYGVFMLNYIPTPAGNGLRLDEVQVLMGHESIQSTQVYARAKQEVIEAKLLYADQLLLSGMGSFEQLPALIADQYRLAARRIEGETQ